MAEHNKIGKIGEDIAARFLVKHGFSIVLRNYRTKYGEIDIIAKKDSALHFVEVKSVKVRNFNELENLRVRPEDNLTSAKLSKIKISIETYLQHKNISETILRRISLACVYINTETRQGLVKLVENITLN